MSGDGNSVLRRRRCQCAAALICLLLTLLCLIGAPEPVIAETEVPWDEALEVNDPTSFPIEMAEPPNPIIEIDELSRADVAIRPLAEPPPPDASPPSRKPSVRVAPLVFVAVAILVVFMAVSMVHLAIRSHRRREPADGSSAWKARLLTTESVVLRQAGTPKWIKGMPHPRRHLVAAAQTGHWVPAPGYGWADDPPDVSNVVWRPGTHHPDEPLVAGDQEGQWVPAPGYTWSEHGPTRSSG